MLRLNGYSCLSAFVVASVIVCPNLQSGARAQAPVETSMVAPPAAETSVRTSLTASQTGDLLMSQQRYQAAIAAYARSTELTARIWNKMGIAYQLMFDSDDAVHCFAESLKLDPNDYLVLNNLGAVYQSQKDYDAADRMYRKAIEAKPHFALAYKNLGTNLIAQHKFKQGQEAYAQAMALDPDIFAASKRPKVEYPTSARDRGAMNYYIASACVRAGNTDCALEYLRISLNEGYTDPKKVTEDTAFATLSGDPRFRKLLEEETLQ